MCQQESSDSRGSIKTKAAHGLRGFRKVAWRKRTTSSAASPVCRVSRGAGSRRRSCRSLWRAAAKQVRFSAPGEMAAATCAQVPACAAPAPYELAETRVRALGNAAMARRAAPTRWVARSATIAAWLAVAGLDASARSWLRRRPDAARYRRWRPAPCESPDKRTLVRVLATSIHHVLNARTHALSPGADPSTRG